MRISDWSSDVCSSDLPALAAHLDLQDAFAGRFVVHDLDVPQLKPRRLIGPQPGVAHEQNIIVKGLADFTPARLGRVLRPLARRFVEHLRSEEHTSELQSLMRISYAVFCLKQQKTNTQTT